MNSSCATLPTWEREKFWATKVTGDPAILPKWDYSKALEEIKERPTIEFNSSSKETLNETQVVSRESYEIQSKFMVMFEYIEMLQARYA